MTDSEKKLNDYINCVNSSYYVELMSVLQKKEYEEQQEQFISKKIIKNSLNIKQLENDDKSFLFKHLSSKPFLVLQKI